MSGSEGGRITHVAAPLWSATQHILTASLIDVTPTLSLMWLIFAISALEIDLGPMEPIPRRSSFAHLILRSPRRGVRGGGRGPWLRRSVSSPSSCSASPPPSRILPPFLPSFPISVTQLHRSRRRRRCNPPPPPFGFHLI